MAPSNNSSEYVIYHPENLRLSTVFTTFAFRDSSALVETNTTVGVGNLIAIITVILQTIFLWFSERLARFGNSAEYTLNVLSLNSVILRFLYRCITGSLVKPNPESADYKSISGHVDGRADLYKLSTHLLNHLPGIEGTDTVNEIDPLELCIMASKVAYENHAYVENVVTNRWKMHFVWHDDFWNENLQYADTQTFICCDRKEDARLTVVAFRGTEPLNARDWAADIDLSFLTMGEMGKVHIGFMNALGLQDQHDYKKGWPKDHTGHRKLAYYTIRETLKTLLRKNKGARILVTGHSLGGALTILFSSILSMHQEDDVLDSLLGVYTFGQPRVGDRNFGKFMNAQLNAISKRYHRVVFRYDIVPRVPFKDPISQFAHFGGCIYYNSWYRFEMRTEEPNPNYFSPLHLHLKYFYAWLDLFRGLMARIMAGKYFEESSVSIMSRIVGLVVPGVASHSTREYLNSAKLAKITMKDGIQKVSAPNKPRSLMHSTSKFPVSKTF